MILLHVSIAFLIKNYYVNSVWLKKSWFSTTNSCTENGDKSGSL